MRERLGRQMGVLWNWSPAFPLRFPFVIKSVTTDREPAWAPSHPLCADVVLVSGKAGSEVGIALLDFCSPERTIQEPNAHLALGVQFKKITSIGTWFTSDLIFCNGEKETVFQRCKISQSAFKGPRHWSLDSISASASDLQWENEQLAGLGGPWFTFSFRHKMAGKYCSAQGHEPPSQTDPASSPSSAIWWLCSFALLNLSKCQFPSL